MTAIEKAGYKGKIQIGMDVAASEFCKNKMYDLDFKNPKSDPATYVSMDNGYIWLAFYVFMVTFLSYYRFETAPVSSC